LTGINTIVTNICVDSTHVRAQDDRACGDCMHLGATKRSHWAHRYLTSTFSLGTWIASPPPRRSHGVVRPPKGRHEAAARACPVVVRSSSDLFLFQLLCFAAFTQTSEGHTHTHTHRESISIALAPGPAVDSTEAPIDRGRAVAKSEATPSN
jgi:hypothetical protein